jgi:hypothetical protein
LTTLSAKQDFRTEPTDRSRRSPLSDYGLAYHKGRRRYWPWPSHPTVDVEMPQRRIGPPRTPDSRHFSVGLETFLTEVGRKAGGGGKAGGALVIMCPYGPWISPPLVM